MTLRKALAVMLGSLLLATTASAYSPNSANIGVYVTKSTGSDLGYVTASKTQSGATELFISNNPESMNSSTIFSGKASVLGYTNLAVGKTYRIYVAHTNDYGSTLNFALMIKGTSAGSFTLTKKNVVRGTSSVYATIGVNSARDFLNSSVNEPLAIPTSWTYYDGPYSMSAGENIQGWWEITVNSGSGVAIGVTAAPVGVDIQSSWRTGNTQDAPKGQMTNENHTAVGLFKSLKTVNITVDLDTYGLNAYGKDKLGHYFNSGDSTTSDATGYDGWVGEASLGSGQGSTYLPGNYGVIYKYNVTFKSTLGRKGAVYIGRNPAGSGTTGSIGLALKPSSGLAISLGPIANPDISKGWLVVQDVTGTSTGIITTFDILVPGNIEMPYMVYFERVY